ncbi:hypothetical protein, partial [Bradyrhizobium canariense]|uniref:hypothetical protein n=1 Tax=Bradyrhizobium canariense TaxID=255045 RepID=UPI001A7E0D76
HRISFVKPNRVPLPHRRIFSDKNVDRPHTLHQDPLHHFAHTARTTSPHTTHIHNFDFLHLPTHRSAPSPPAAARRRTIAAPTAWY